jgi:ParB-like chromosome segregation protein Spo0J
MKFDTIIEFLDIELIKPYANNAKTHPQSQIEKLGKHIEAVGWDQPIVVDENLEVLKGHGRLLAAQYLGLARVPVVTKLDLTDKQKKMVRLADNKLAETPWDTGLLDAELLELDIPKIELEDIGFVINEPEAFEFIAPNDEPKEDLPTMFTLRVIVANEEEQQALFAELNDRGYKVKV